MNTFLKYTTVIFYAVFLFTFLISVFGKNTTGSFLNSTAEKTLAGTGFSKSRIDSLDNKIDESIYTLDTYAYQISKIKNLFSDTELTPPKKIKNEYIAGSLYNPAVSAVTFILRIIFFAVSFITLLAAVIFNLLYKLSSISKRLRLLETKVIRIEAKALQQ